MKATQRVPLCRCILFGVLLVCLPAGVEAEELVTRANKVHPGHAFPGAQEYRLNPYGSTAPEMTLGVRTFRTRDVLEVRESPTPAGFMRKVMALPARDLKPRLTLMRWAQTRRLRPEIIHAAALVLQQAPTNQEALGAIKGPKRWAKLERGHPVLDGKLVMGLRRLIHEERGTDRKAGAKRLAAGTGGSLPAHLVERMARSLTATRGLVRQVPLTWGAGAFGKAARYDLFVPPDYDPLEPRPLLLALHGGGIMRSEGEKVLGSGRDALALYLDGCRREGWIVVAPNAIEAPWDARSNEGYLLAVLAEITALWNVDLERIHLAGTGGGGDGVWAFAERHAEDFATVSVAAAGTPQGYTGIAQKSALWLYHGGEDEIVPVLPVRKAAERLLRGKADFVYCELPEEKHGLPPAAERDYFFFAAPRRRRKAKATWPRASFAVPPTPEEIAAFGDPAGGWGVTLEPTFGPQDLLQIVRTGRLDTEPAARRLAVLGAGANQARFAPPLRAIVKDRDASVRARAWAAWILGQWRDADALNVLGDVLRSADDPVLRRLTAGAIERLANPDSQEDLRWALRDLSGRYKALKGKTIPYVAYERACRLGAALARAMGRLGNAAEVQADLEEALVIGILRDPRRVIHRVENGENPTALKSALAEALGRAYRTMNTDRTVGQMLLTVLRRDPQARQAAAKGLREGLPAIR